MKCHDKTRKGLCNVEKVHEKYLKFEILAVSESYFTVGSQSDEKSLLREVSRNK